MERLTKQELAKLKELAENERKLCEQLAERLPKAGFEAAVQEMEELADKLERMAEEAKQ